MRNLLTLAVTFTFANVNDPQDTFTKRISNVSPVAPDAQIVDLGYAIATATSNYKLAGVVVTRADELTLS